MNTSVHDCKLIDLPKISERKGAITPIYSQEHIPFEIKRIFYLYDVPGGEGRGAHAHKTLHQFIIAVMGAFEVVLDDGQETKRVRLDRAYHGLHVPPMIWANEENFSSGGICLVLASTPYDETDYIRDYQTFIECIRNG
jgi:hypothetical protein